MVTTVRLKAKGMEMYKSGIVINYVNAVLTDAANTYQHSQKSNEKCNVKYNV